MRRITSAVTAKPRSRQSSSERRGWEQGRVNDNVSSSIDDVVPETQRCGAKDTTYWSGTGPAADVVPKTRQSPCERGEGGYWSVTGPAAGVVPKT